MNPEGGKYYAGHQVELMLSSTRLNWCYPLLACPTTTTIATAKKKAGDSIILTSQCPGSSCSHNRSHS